MVKQYKEQAEKLHAEYKDKISKMEAEHADEVLLLREELKAIQVRGRLGSAPALPGILWRRSEP